MSFVTASVDAANLMLEATCRKSEVLMLDLVRATEVVQSKAARNDTQLGLRKLPRDNGVRIFQMPTTSLRTAQRCRRYGGFKHCIICSRPPNTPGQASRSPSQKMQSPAKASAIATNIVFNIEWASYFEQQFWQHHLDVLGNVDAADLSIAGCDLMHITRWGDATRKA